MGATQNVTPLDPDSPKGKRIAKELTEVLAQIRVEIEAAQRRTSTASERAA